MRKAFALLAFLCLLYAGTAFGQAVSAYNGICESGNVAVSINGTQGSQNQKFQQSFPQCTITVYKTGTLTLATIYADSMLTSLANPFTAQNSGRFQFYIQAGTYDIQLSGGGLSAPFTISAVQIGNSFIINGTCDASAQVGTDAAAKINACSVSMSSTGGVINALGLTGVQTWSVCPTFPSEPVTLIMGVGTTTVNVFCTLPSTLTLQMNNGAILATGQVVTILGEVEADVSTHFQGTAPFGLFNFGTGSSRQVWVYPQWWGSKLDGVDDDAPGINAAILACEGTLVSSVFQASCGVRMSAGKWQINTQIKMYDPTQNHGIQGLQLIGMGKGATQLKWGGSNSIAAIRMIGPYQKVADFALQDLNSVGWVAGIQYDGDPGIGISTAGKIADVQIDCNTLLGHGIAVGQGGAQADQLTIDHPYIQGCYDASGIVVAGPLSSGTTVQSPTILHCFIGVNMAIANTEIAVLGGDFEFNEVDLAPNFGGTYTATGFRSNGSKHVIVGTSGTFNMPVYLSGIHVNSTYWGNNPSQGRQAATATSTSSQNITLSNVSVTLGDYITIAGAGAGGSTLHTHIGSMGDPFHAALDTNTIITPVTGASVALDTSVEQNNFYLAGGGPYVIQGVYLNSGQLEGSFAVPSNDATITIMGWGSGEIPAHQGNPFNLPNTSPWPTGASWFAVFDGGLPGDAMQDHIYNPVTPATTTTFGLPSGANNAWVVNTNEPLAPGLRLVITGTTKTLQAGVNTLNYNSSGTLNIFKASSLSNLTTGVPVSATVELIFDGSQWRLLGQ